MDYGSFLELVKKRRSIHRFKPDPVPDEYIDQIIEAARWAPSGFNLQPWEFVVVRDQKLKDGIVQIFKEATANTSKMEAAREPWQIKSRPTPPPSQPSEPVNDYTKAPVFIILFGDARTNVGLPMVRRYDYPQMQGAFLSGLASAFLYMHLAATSLGLASQWVSRVATPYGHCLVKHLLGVPHELEAYDMMVVGYPDGEPRPRIVRNKEEMVHYDYCGEGAFRSDEAVSDFIIKIRNP
ncbi:nitroreductase family protein [Chloroflexota bacterium]